MGCTCGIFVFAQFDPHINLCILSATEVVSKPGLLLVPFPPCKVLSEANGEDSKQVSSAFLCSFESQS